MRVTKNGKGTFSKVLDSYNLLCEHSLDIGVVTVVNKLNVTEPDQVFDFALTYGIRKLQLSPCMETFEGSDDFSITPNEFSNFLVRIFDRWFSLDDPTFNVGFIGDIVKHLLGFKQENCMLNDSCHNFAVLDWTGVLKTCDGMRNKQSIIANTESSITSSGFQRDWETFHKRITNQRKSECNQCEWYGLCYGGCPYHWFEENGLFKTAFCQSHKVIFTHIANALLKKMS
ncbi:MAG: radical SAM domain-containing protein, partial [Parcubacteria group bacterium GW2011_GWC2_42_11]